MNLFFVTKDGRIVTPELTGSILEGVTRSSILELAKELGLEPEERRIPIEEWKEGVASGEHRRDLRLRHGGRRHPGRRAALGGRLASTTAARATRTATPRRSAPALLDIQYGRAEDTHGWLTRLA